MIPSGLPSDSFMLKEKSLLLEEALRENAIFRMLLVDLSTYPDIPGELDPDTQDKWNQAFEIIERTTK